MCPYQGCLRMTKRGIHGPGEAAVEQPRVIERYLQRSLVLRARQQTPQRERYIGEAGGGSSLGHTIADRLQRELLGVLVVSEACLLRRSRGSHGITQLR